MTYADLLRQRLHNQHVSARALASPADVVYTLGAIQAQDYVAARWALALRVKRIGEAQLDEAFAGGAFLRTHVMRPTWHFVAPSDIRWLLALTAPRVNAVCGHYYRKYEVDDRVIKRSRAVLERVLRGRRLQRRALQTALEQSSVLRRGDDPLRLIFLLLRAELDAVICSGPREASQFTYMLLEERVPAANALGRDEARAELARRFFTSHGPATLKDFSWWSGLSMADGRAGVAAASEALDCLEIDGQTYYQPRTTRAPKRGSPRAYLIPAYDESVLAYRDSRAALKPYAKQLTRDIGQVIAIDGRAVGTWRRRVTSGVFVLEASPFDEFTRGERDAIADAVHRYGGFHQLPASVQFRARR